MELLSPKHWKDYELIDSGEFEKLERFGNYITIRPEPQAVWDRNLSEKEWNKLAHVKFVSKSSSSGVWEKKKPMPDQWVIKYNINGDKSLPELGFRLGLTSFKHVGIFPEQSENWDFIYDSIKKMKTPSPKVLNLFAYTGGASLAAKAAGADITHLDSIKQVITWSKENMELSNLKDIRWVVEDALTFVRRELKRGKKYNGIILDPPAYGQGTNGERWKLEDNINEMIKGVSELLDEQENFMVLNTYSLGFSALIIENLLKDSLKGKSNISIGEIYLQASSGNKLPLGVFGRCRNF
jgi:23S rRNA (cytosine1962-C5)-methyltransferase